MSVFCHTKTKCSSPPKGYNVCIENTTELDQTYVFGPLPVGANDFINTQSVTVPRNTSICYRILSPPGETIIIAIEDPVNDEGPQTYGGAFTCSVHITTRTVVSAAEGTLATGFFTTLDCSPCPCPCEFTCAPEKKACAMGIGMELGITKKLVELCSDSPCKPSTIPDGIAKIEDTKSCCESASCYTEGYNVCIENTVTMNARLEFFYADPTFGPRESPTVQSMTVNAGNTVCYRINVRSGAVIGVRPVDIVGATIPVYISCPAHLKLVIVPDSTLPFLIASDCSPCPVPCGDKYSCKLDKM